MSFSAHTRCVLRFRSIVAAMIVAGLASVAHAAAKTVRLSDWMSPEQQAESGFQKLSGEEIAVINAIANQDAVAKRKGGKTDEIPPTFSGRRTDHEWKITGLGNLTPGERANLDEFVAAWLETRPAVSRPAPFVALSSAEDDMDVSVRNRPRVGGAVSVTYGVAEGGGTLRSGSVVVDYDDPARGFSASVGYSKTTADGGFVAPRVIVVPPAAPANP